MDTTAEPPTPTLPADLPPAAHAALNLFLALRHNGVTPDVAAQSAAAMLRETPSRLLTPEEFAAFVNREVFTVNEWVRTKAVKAVRVKGKAGQKTVVGFHLESALKAMSE